MLKLYVAILLFLGIGRFILTTTYGAPTTGGDAVGGATAILLVLVILEIDKRLGALESNGDDGDRS